MKRLNIEMTVKQAAHECYVFSYKKRLWTAGAYLPWKNQYEIWTMTDERCSYIEPDTKVIARYEYPF